MEPMSDDLKEVCRQFQCSLKETKKPEKGGQGFSKKLSLLCILPTRMSGGLGGNKSPGWKIKV